jgi:aspartokinase/homoserine dehydrogenase 1
LLKITQLHKALNVIHGEIFWRSQENKYCCFGHGLVGTLINQILESAAAIEKKKRY